MVRPGRALGLKGKSTGGSGLSSASQFGCEIMVQTKERIVRCRNMNVPRFCGFAQDWLYHIYFSSVADRPVVNAASHIADRRVFPAFFAAWCGAGTYACAVVARAGP